MTYLFSFTIAGIAARLKTSVTGLLQGSLQGFRALARLGDVSYPEDPPLALRPLRVDTTGRPSAVQGVLAGSLLLCLCLLSVFALPMETTAHPDTPPLQDEGDPLKTLLANPPINPGDTSPEGYGQWYEDHSADAKPKHRYSSRSISGNPPRFWHMYSNKPVPDFADLINWVRVYKNPKTSPATVTGHVATGASALQPSLHWEENVPGWSADQAIWVDFNTMSGDGSLLPDPEKDDSETGLVTEKKNTTVKVGDRVAIAVNFTTWGGGISSDMAIGPRVDTTYEWQADPFARDAEGNFLRRGGSRYRVWKNLNQIHREGVWRLNPNLPLTSGTTGHTHTLVYQFVVKPEHAILNAEGPWLKQDFYYVPDEGIDPGAGYRYDGPERTPHGVQHAVEGNRKTAVDWLYGKPDGTLPKPTAVKVWNTLSPIDRERLNWNASGAKSQTPGWTYHRYSNHRDHTRSHRHVPMYDPAAKERIYYPKVVVGNTKKTTVSSSTAITDVPTGTQTGAFQVTLAFSEVQEIADFTVSRVTFEEVKSSTVEGPGSATLTPPPWRSDIPVSGASVTLFVAHDVSAAGVAKFQTSLTAALAAADPPWTVTALTYAGGAEIASLEGHGTATRYTLTLSPALGLKGDIALQIPAGVVSDVAGTPNVASETVMVSVDTSLRLAAGAAVEIVEPESGTYLGGDALEVRVPFAADGLTYEGNNPPYITIYLGERTSANARHATWQRGAETSGSTIVPFVYVVNAADPVVSSVVVGSEGLSVPEGTTLTSSSGLSRVGTAAPPKDSGEEAPAPPPSDDAGSEQVVLATDTGAPLPETEAAVNVSPVLWLPTEESEPKSVASSVPRTPIVFNELGNGSGADNDWLELRNVTDAAVSLKDWELSVVADAKKEDTSLVVFPDVSVPANGLLLLTNMPSDKTPLAGGDDITPPAGSSDKKRKGLTHLSLVDDGLSLPDDGKFLLILRNAKEKRNLNEAFVDVAGGGGSGTDAFIREQTGLYDTHVWPLQVLEAPGSDTEDSLSAGKVWLRAKADIVGYHRDAWAEAAFSGLGYDRKVSKSAETAGTPGYPNGAVKTQPATPKGAITMSEVMFDSAGGTLPQWIELYNTSKTEALNLNRWELEIQNRKSKDLVGRPIVTLTLQEKVIQPNQTLLIVTGNARASSADVFPADRVYNLIELHEKNLRIKTPRDTFLSVEGFYLKLTDTNGHLVDEIGNTDGDRRTDDTPAWALPVPLSEVEGMRSSLVRRYDNGVARDGTSREGWALAANFAKFKADGLHYGHADDIGTPGYRQGGALPVELSSFTLTRTESGAVVVTWTTESEVDNAGFNLRRSLQRDSGYTLLNPALIAGAGTTGERQTYTFIDTSAKPGVEHYYQIEEVSFGGKPEMLMTRRLRGPVSPAHRALTTFGEVKQAK